MYVDGGGMVEVGSVHVFFIQIWYVFFLLCVVEDLHKTEKEKKTFVR